MTRRGWLRLMAAGVLVVWLCLFLHWDNTEKSMIRALLVETNGDSWTVGLLYQFPEASADSSEAKAAIRLCIGRGPELSSAISAAEEALPQRADWRLCEYLLAGLDSVRQTLPACEELFLHRPYGRLASRVFGGSFSVETLKERADGSDVLPENLLQCVKNAAPAAPRLYQQSSGFILPVVELEDEAAHYRPEALIITPEQTGQLTESQTEMALLLQGKSWTDTGEHRFALEAGPLRLRRAFCGVEREGEGFLLRVNALARGELPSDAELIPECWLRAEDMRCVCANGTLEVTLSVKAEGAILQRSGNTCVGSIALGEPLTPADPEISLRIYYAQAGEELFAIARRFHVSPAQMLAANDLAEGTTAIDAPQRLLVPGAGG